MYVWDMFHGNLFTRVYEKWKNKDLRFTDVHFVFLHCLLIDDSSSSHQRGRLSLSLGPAVGYMDAEIKDPSVENAELKHSPL